MWVRYMYVCANQGNESFESLCSLQWEAEAIREACIHVLSVFFLQFIFGPLFGVLSQAPVLARYVHAETTV